MEVVSLKTCVILGYTDVAVSGSRTLLGLEEENYEIQPYILKSYPEATPATFHETVTSSPAVVQICSHKTRDVSFIILNAVIPLGKKHVVANEILDLISKSNVKEFIVLSAFPIGSNSTFLKVIDKDLDHESTTKLCTSDPFLNALLQFTIVEPFATLLIAVDGRKAKVDSKPNENDGSLQSIQALHKYLQGELHLDLNMTKSCTLVYKGSENEKENSLMYI